MEQNKRYLIERSEIRPIRKGIVRLPNSVEHRRFCFALLRIYVTRMVSTVMFLVYCLGYDRLAALIDQCDHKS